MSFITDTLGGWTGVDITHTTDKLSTGAAAGSKPTSNPMPTNGSIKSSPYFVPLMIGAALLLVIVLFKRA